MQSVLTFDVETTGLNPAQDQIIELCVQKGFGPEAESRTWRFLPEVPISPQATSVHGITKEDLLGSPRFSECISEIRPYFDSAEALLGYNLEFDLGFVQAEFQRASAEALAIGAKLLLDPYLLWRKMEPRSLSDAHQRFVGTSFEGAHSATEDVAATARVMQGMLKEFLLESKSLKDLAELCGLKRNNWIGPSHHFQWKGKTAVFGFGKNRNKPLQEVYEGDGGDYFAWLARSDFPEHVKLIARTVAVKADTEFTSWLEDTFGAAT